MKKALALLLAAIMILSLAACGGTAPASSSEAAPASSSEAAPASSSEAAPASSEEAAPASSEEAAPAEEVAEPAPAIPVSFEYNENADTTLEKPDEKHKRLKRALLKPFVAITATLVSPASFSSSET